jgi:hypothetical protein
LPYFMLANFLELRPVVTKIPICFFRSFQTITADLQPNDLCFPCYTIVKFCLTSNIWTSFVKLLIANFIPQGPLSHVRASSQSCTLYCHLRMQNTCPTALQLFACWYIYLLKVKLMNVWTFLCLPFFKKTELQLKTFK